MLSCEQEDRFADVVLPAKLCGAFLAVKDLFDEFELEFWCVCSAFHLVSLGEGIPRSFRRGYWSQTSGFTSVCVKRKVSGGFRSVAGGIAFCRLRSYISTLGKQGLSVWDGLVSVFRGDVLMPDFSS